MKEFQTAWTVLLLALIMLFSCSTARKTNNSHKKEQQRKDNSVVNSGYIRETTVTETGSNQVVVSADSLAATGYVPAGDTGSIVSESDDMTITTTSIPKKDSAGRTIGNTIHTKAATKPKTIAAPGDKTTHIRESGSSTEKKDVATIMTQEDKSTSKTVWRPSVGVQIVLGITIVAALLYGIYKLLKVIKR